MTLSAAGHRRLYVYCHLSVGPDHNGVLSTLLYQFKSDWGGLTNSSLLLVGPLHPLPLSGSKDLIRLPYLVAI